MRSPLPAGRPSVDGQRTVPATTTASLPSLAGRVAPAALVLTSPAPYPALGLRHTPPTARPSHPRMTSHALPLAHGPEFDLIRRFLPSPVRAGDRPDVLVGPGDDCAVVAGRGIALSSDMSVEEVHFRRDWLSAREIGYRAAAAALSDLAAVAARPIGLLCSLATSDDDKGRMAVGVMDGVRDAAGHAGAVLLGGDLTRSPGAMAIDVTVVGEASDPVLRSGARPGDELWVTGELGGAAAYVAAMTEGRLPDPSARLCFAAPVPRTREALWLHERGIPRAMLDLSDGLAGDVAHLAAASGVAVLLWSAAIPVHPAARREGVDHGLRLAVAGGEDYELCFAASPGGVAGATDDFATHFGVRLTRVGRVAEGDGVWWENEGGSREPLDARGFQHFARGGA